MNIFVLLNEENETVCVSEDINKIHTSICEDFDLDEDCPKLEIWKDGEQIIYQTYGKDVLKKIAEEIHKLTQ